MPMIKKRLSFFRKTFALHGALRLRCAALTSSRCTFGSEESLRPERSECSSSVVEGQFQAKALVKKNTRKERGQSLVELAVSLPIILLLLMGTIDFGMAIYSYTILKDAAQEGALYGSFDPHNRAGIESRVRSIAPQNLEPTASFPVNLRNKNLVKVDIHISGADCQGITDEASNHIEVSVSYKYQVLTPFINRFIGSKTISLNATATNIILQPPCP